MPITPEVIEETGSYLDLILGGGAVSVLACLFLYHKYLATPQSEDLRKQIAAVNSYIAHERDERKKIEPRLTHLRDEIHAEKAAFVDFLNWYDDFKKDTNIKIREVDDRERTHYQEMRDMQAEDALIKQEIRYVKEKVGHIEKSVDAIQGSIEELKNLFLQQALKGN